MHEHFALLLMASTCVPAAWRLQVWLYTTPYARAHHVLSRTQRAHANPSDAQQRATASRSGVRTRASRATAPASRSSMGSKRSAPGRRGREATPPSPACCCCCCCCMARAWAAIRPSVAAQACSVASAAAWCWDRIGRRCRDSSSELACTRGGQGRGQAVRKRVVRGSEAEPPLAAPVRTHFAAWCASLVHCPPPPLPPSPLDGAGRRCNVTRRITSCYPQQPSASAHNRLDARACQVKRQPLNLSGPPCIPHRPAPTHLAGQHARAQGRQLVL